jgi:hypothetical protein
MPIAEKTIVITRHTTPLLRHEVQAEGRKAAWDAKTAEVMAHLDAADVDPDAGRRICRAALKARGIKASDAVLNKAIDTRRAVVGVHVLKIEEDD